MSSAGCPIPADTLISTGGLDNPWTQAAIPLALIGGLATLLLWTIPYLAFRFFLPRCCRKGHNEERRTFYLQMIGNTPSGFVPKPVPLPWKRIDNPPEVTFLSLTSSAVIARIRFDEATTVRSETLLGVIRQSQGTGLSPHLRTIEMFWSLDEVPAPRQGHLPPSVCTIQRGQLALFGSPLARAVFLDWLSAGPTYDQNWELAGVKPATIPYALLCDPNYREQEEQQLTKKQRKLEMPDANAAARLLLAGCRDELALLPGLGSQDLLSLTYDELEAANIRHPNLFTALREPSIRQLRCDTWLPPDTSRPLNLSAPVVQIWNLDDPETQLALASSAACFVICFQHDPFKAVLAQCTEACTRGHCTVIVLGHELDSPLVSELLGAEAPFKIHVRIVNPSRARGLTNIRKKILGKLTTLYLPAQRVQQLTERLASRQTNALEAGLQDLAPLLLPTGLVGQIPGETDIHTDVLELLVAWDSKYHTYHHNQSAEMEAETEAEAKAKADSGHGPVELDREECFVFSQPPTQSQARLLRRLLASLGPVALTKHLLRVPHQAAFRANTILATPPFKSCVAVPVSSPGFAALLEAEYKALPPPKARRRLSFYVLVDDQAELSPDRLTGLASVRGVCLPAPGRPAQCILWRPAERDESFWALDSQDLSRRFSVECRAGDSRFLVEITPNPSRRHPKPGTYATVFGHALRRAAGEPRFLPSFNYSQEKGWTAAVPLVDYAQVPLPTKEQPDHTVPKIGALTEAEAVALALRRVSELATRRHVTGEQLLRPKIDEAEQQAQVARADNSLTTVAVLVLFLCFALAPVVLLGVSSYWIPVLLLVQELLAILGGLLFVAADVSVRFSKEAFRQRSRRSLQLKAASSVMLSVCAGLNVAIIAMAFTA